MNDCELFTWVKGHGDRSSRSIHTISVNDATRKFIRNKICKLSYFILNGSCVSCVCIVVVLVSASVAVCLPFALLYLPRKICWITILNYSRLSACARDGHQMKTHRNIPNKCLHTKIECHPNVRHSNSDLYTYFTSIFLFLSFPSFILFFSPIFPLVPHINSLTLHSFYWLSFSPD